MEKTFEEIWGAWPEGPSLLMDLVTYWQGRSLVIARTLKDAYQLYVQLPLPMTHPSLGGFEYSTLIPEQLQQLFVERCNLVLAAREEAAIKALAAIDQAELTMLELVEASNVVLKLLEEQLTSAGALSLSALALQAFGLDPATQPAGLLAPSAKFADAWTQAGFKFH